MPKRGYIQVHAYTSNAQIPLEGVAIAITDASGAVTQFRLTDENGKLQVPIPIDVPDLAYSLTPNTGTIPFSIVNLYARVPDYELIEVKNLQVFPGVVTDQQLEMIPLAEYPDSFLKSESFDTPQQNL